MGVLKTVLANIRQTDVVTGSHVEDIEADATSHLHAPVETPEVVVILVAKTVIRRAIVEVLDFPSYPTSDVTAQERFYRQVARGKSYT